MSDIINTGKNALVANFKTAAPIFVVGVVASAALAVLASLRK